MEAAPMMKSKVEIVQYGIASVQRIMKIIIVEPSMFRWGDTYMLGPFGRLRAWWVAHREVRQHPFSEVRVVSADGQVLWPRQDYFDRAVHVGRGLGQSLVDVENFYLRWYGFSGGDWC